MANSRTSASALLKKLDKLTRTHKFSELAEAAAGVTGPEQRVAKALLEAAHISQEGQRSPLFDERVTSALATADHWWEQGRTGDAAHALAAGVRLLFHRELHADVGSTPLAQDPVQYLRPLHTSQMFSDLSAPLPYSEQVKEDGRVQRGTTRVVVLPGSYPNFAVPLVAALEENPGIEVETLDLSDYDRRLKWLGTNAEVLHHRAALQRPGTEMPGIGGPVETIRDANVIMADWGDRGAMWASCHAPAGARVVIRLHGMDAFSPWLHFVDWSRVSDLIAVSAPLLDLVKRILGDRLEGVRLHAIEHTVDSEQFTPADRDGKDYTLGMIGWGKMVKDPAWALDVLEGLLEDGDPWKLILLGDPLLIEGSARTQKYTREVWKRIEGPLADHVEILPYTKNVAFVASRMGYILSTSRRESFHLAVPEGVLSGAVPVVRDWPVYGGAGPAGIYPSSWIVATPADAAARIRETLGRRRAVAAGAREIAARRFSSESFLEQIWRAVLTSPDLATTPEEEARAVISDLTLTGETTKNLAAVAARVLERADEHLDQSDLEAAAECAALGLDVLFHRELHSDVIHSPLVRDPHGFLEPLRRSRVGSLLTGNIGTPAQPSQGEKVVVTPGPFNDFHLWMVDALRTGEGVEVRIAERNRRAGFNTLRMDPGVVRERLTYALTGAPTGHEEFRGEIEAADVLVLDWADKMAVLTTMLAPQRTRMVVRLHSVDFLRPWLFLIDWGRVESIICLSQGMADLTRDLLVNGAGVEPPPIHIVRNEAPIHRLERDKSPRAERTLGMIGWAKRVKDPIWALDLLAELRKDDPRWRLVLIGPMFAERGTASGIEYERRFWNRANAPDIREHIIFTGFTEDVGTYLQEIGFILSTSRRESFHRAVLEGAISGAVPVVRDWPIFERHQAAATVYPQEWVVREIGKAAQRIRDVVRQGWHEEASVAREQMLRLTDLETLGAQYREIILGQ